MMSLQIYWDRHKDVTLDDEQRNVLIRDIPQKSLSRICDYMVENSFKPNRLYAQLKLHELPNVEEYYRRYVMHVLRDECSIMVIDEKTNEIFGVALVKLMTKEWRSWTIWLQVLDTSTLFSEFMLLRRMHLLKFYEEHPDRDCNSLHLFEYYMRSELKADAVFMRKFFNAIFEVARHLLMPHVTFVGTTLEEQLEAEAAGFHALSHLIYSLLENQGVRAFQSLRDIDEMYMVLYEREIEPITPFYRLPPPHVYDEEDRLKHEKRSELEEEADTSSKRLDMDNKRQSVTNLAVK
ncbi:uncharacterized protein LOC129239459 [Anastrepha obliqua]|uniref:uncharacterized protein LOC129239459 n=1 Tax=Anastrepha obliqua TaxID=95512 RepID=UPI002408F65C|nr:uncharacterized protein LOC129239459 [Anastrepha obliqua]